MVVSVTKPYVDDFCLGFYLFLAVLHNFLPNA